MPRKYQKQSSNNCVHIQSPTSETTDPSSLLNFPFYLPKVQKPRRNKSAFLLFSSEKRAMLKASGENLNSNQMMAKLADLWNNISSEERRRYDMEAIDEKKRYVKEVETFKKQNPYAGEIHNKTKKNHIKKPCSAYGIFVKEITIEIKKENPSLLMADVLKVVSQKWKNLGETEKLRYQDKATQEKLIAREKLEDYYTHLETEVKEKKTKPSGEVRKQVKMDTDWFVDVDPDTYNIPASFSDEQQDLSDDIFFSQENFAFSSYETSPVNALSPSSFCPQVEFQLTQIPEIQQPLTPFVQIQEYDLSKTLKFVLDEFSVEDQEIPVQNVLERYNSSNHLFFKFDIESDPLMHDAFELFDRIHPESTSASSSPISDLEDLSLTSNCSFSSCQQNLNSALLSVFD